MLGTFVVIYLFLGGCGAAVLIVAASWSLLFSRTLTRSGPQSHLFAALRGRLYTMSFFVLALSALCLLLDLGRPGLAFLLFLRPTASLLSVGSFALAACLITSACLAAANLLFRNRVPSSARKAVEVLSLVPALFLLVYTGAYMAVMESVPLWNNAALPWLIAFSSLSSGLSLTLVFVSFFRYWELLLGWVEALRRLHGVILVLELASLVLFVLIAAGNPFAASSLGVLLDPWGLGSWFIVGFVVLGVLVPLAAEYLVPLLKSASIPLFAEVTCFAGGLILRFCLVLAGSHWLG